MFVLSSFSSLFCAGIECSVSMDSVLQKRYQGKLEHQVVPLYEVLLPPCRLSAPGVAPPQLVGSFTATGSQLDPNFAMSPVVIVGF